LNSHYECSIFSERYCGIPQDPDHNGGLYDWDSSLGNETPYGTKVTYSCDKARQLQRFDEYANGTVVEVLHETQEFTCAWDTTWQPLVPVRQLIENFQKYQVSMSLFVGGALQMGSMFESTSASRTPHFIEEACSRCRPY
jgi:hypothetical protein